MNAKHQSVRHGGFSLTELVLASGISCLLVLGALSTFLIQTSAYKAKRMAREANQNARAAVDAVARDLRAAGYGIHVPDAELTQWLPWATGMTVNPLVTQGSGAAPDAVRIAAAFGAPSAALALQAPAGATSISVGSGQGAQFDDATRRTIFVDQCETARVTGRMGDVLTISTDPVLSGRGLRYRHEAGAPVEVVRVVRYACEPQAQDLVHQPYLVREELGVAVTQRWVNMVAGYIEDMQCAVSGHVVSVSVTAREREADRAYVHPVKRDHVRRVTLTARVTPRNLLLGK